MNHAPTLDIHGHVATLTLQRPAAANKITPHDLVTLRQHVEAVNQTPEVLLLVLRSTGKHFCAGYDITQVGGSQTEGQGFGEMVDAVENCRAVTLAVVQGGVYGGATDMVLACDGKPVTLQVVQDPSVMGGSHFVANLTGANIFALRNDGRVYQYKSNTWIEVASGVRAIHLANLR